MSKRKVRKNRAISKVPKKEIITPRKIQVAQGSAAERVFRIRAGLSPVTTEIAPGLPATPTRDLIYHGGRTISHLSFMNLYVGGSSSWVHTDTNSIDKAISGAMADKNLNNVMAQYFHGEKITSIFKGSKILDGSRPEVFTRKNIESTLEDLYLQNKLSIHNLKNTVFNLILPRRTILADPDIGEASEAKLTIAKKMSGRRERSESSIPHEEEGDSLSGLGGYHGSIHVKKGTKTITLYYSINVYSEVLSNGKENGIPFFDKPWKNIVATLYHELNEARTDPDVDDVIATNNLKLWGWADKKGYECGDFPIEEAGDLGSIGMVFKEVPLANGTGTVPIQLQYSNAVHGPEGPISSPH